MLQDGNTSPRVRHGSSLTVCTRLGVTTDIHSNFLVDFGTYLDTLPNAVYNYQKVYLQSAQQCKSSKMSHAVAAAASSERTYGIVIGTNENNKTSSDLCDDNSPFLPWRWLNVDWSETSSSADKFTSVCAMNPWDLKFCPLASLPLRQQKQPTPAATMELFAQPETRDVKVAEIHTRDKSSEAPTTIDDADGRDGSNDIKRIRL